MNLGDIHTVSKGVIAFGAVAAVLVLLSGTAAYPIALGIAVIALLYVMLESGFPLLLNQVTSFIAGSTASRGS